MVKIFRVSVAFSLALVCLTSPVFVSTVSPAWAVATWSQAGFDIDGETAGDVSGKSVSLSPDGSKVAIGAPGNDGAGDNAGHVRVYTGVGGALSQLGPDINGEAAGDNSGYSVSLSSDGSRVAIGAPFNAGNGESSGHVRVYDLNAGIWVQVGTDIDAEAAGNFSGASVSLSSDGSTVAIGAEGNDGAGDNAGHVRVYRLTSDAWVQVGSDIDGEAAGDYSGRSVSLSSDGSRIAIGAEYNSGGGLGAGHVRVYDLNAGAWAQVGTDIDGEAAGDALGYSVSLSSSGFRVAISAKYNSGGGLDAGHVRVYELSVGAWAQVGSDIDGEAAGDESGTSVSLSSDGSRVAIGAQNNAGGGSQRGHVRVYSLTAGSWVQAGSDIDGQDTFDMSGDSVSLSSDGSRVAISSRSHSGDTGNVRVFDLSGGGDGGDGITSEPRGLKVIKKTKYSRTLEWKVPSSLNEGMITDYVIQFRARGTTEWSTFADGISTNRRVKVTGLTQKVKYKFRVAARTVEGDSPYSTATKAS